MEFLIWHGLAIISLSVISFFGGYKLAIKNELRNAIRKVK